MFRIFFIVAACLGITACDFIQKEQVRRLCKSKPEVCQHVHQGGMCFYEKHEVLNSLVDLKASSSALQAYETLLKLEDYKNCLDSVRLLENRRNKQFQNSRLETLRNLPALQDRIAQQHQGDEAVEIWLWDYRLDPSGEASEKILNWLETAPEPSHYVLQFAANQNWTKPQIAMEYLRTAILQFDDVADLPESLLLDMIAWHKAFGELQNLLVWSKIYTHYFGSELDLNYFTKREMPPEEIDITLNWVDNFLFKADYWNHAPADLPDFLFQVSEEQH